MNNSAIKNGLILGALSTVILFVVYMIDITILSSWEIIVPSLIVFIGLYFFFALQMRKEAGGFMTFKQAFVSIFVMVMIAGVFSTVFKILLFNIIDTDISEDVKRATIEQVESMYESMGIADNEASIQAITDLEEKDFSMNLQNTGMELGMLLLGSAFYGIIIGAIIKKNPPLNFAGNEDSDDDLL